MREWVDLARNLPRRPFRASIPDKGLSHLSYLRHRAEQASATARYEVAAVDTSGFIESVDPVLAAEAERAAEHISATAVERLARAGLTPWGRADHHLLYFLVRLLAPATVVETGVAQGFSSAAILSALEANGSGRLFSSDLPYVRDRDPQRNVGIVVPPDLRARWELLLEGDNRNLRTIVRATSTVDLVHYDSDKSWRGRVRALRILGPSLAPNAVVVFDDIGDNGHFQHHLDTTGWWGTALRSRGRYLGVCAAHPPSALAGGA